MRLAIIGLLVTASVNSWAAPTKDSDTQLALQMPISNRLRIFKTQGPSAVQDLEKVAFDNKLPLAERWRAITVLGRVFPNESRSVLEKALQSSDWYLRNAVAVGLKYSERNWAIQQARVLMHDSALVVRTSAVTALNEMGAIEAEDLLWEKLYSSENFSKGQSLWIRKHIAEILSGFAHKGQEQKFFKMLKDRDESLHPHAVAALNRIAGTKRSREEWLTN